MGAGDIASCALTADSETAALLESLPGTVFTAGDDAYEDGSAYDFSRCYAPTWGRLKARTRPAIGNHDRISQNGALYFAYFGSAAGQAPDGWYSFELGGWHIVVLDADCGSVGGCGTGSRELTWLESDLAAHPAACTMAIWHQPRFSSGLHGDDHQVAPFWEALMAAGAEIVVNGHDHDYERFAPQDPDGTLDPAKGIREFVVGTGGAELRAFTSLQPNSEVRNASTHGVIEFGLYPNGYTWRFLGVPGSSFTDSGSGTCH